MGKVFVKTTTPNPLQFLALKERWLPCPTYSGYDLLIDLDLPGAIDLEEQSNLSHCLQTQVLNVKGKTTV